MTDRLRTTCLAALLTGLSAAPALAAPDREAAERLFAEADAICTRDDGQLWGVSICGPILIVDWQDRMVIANQADAGGVLTADGNVFVGQIPESVIIANTPTDWSGTRWTQLVAPLPEEAGGRHVLVAHELFHRVQNTLNLTRPEAANHHLDTLEGRYLLQLEWRALAAALTAGDESTRRTAMQDALLFREERYRLFPAAAAEEAALEVNEGVPEYTGVRLGLETPEARTAHAVQNLSAFVSAPTFVRSFAYATGAAYGLMLDDAAPDWRTRLNDGPAPYQMLANALSLTAAENLTARAAVYDADGTLWTSEETRDAERQARLAAYRARLIDGPVLVLPLADTNYQFNPQTLVALDGVGTIYPTMRLNDDWGSLVVEAGGALVSRDPRQATVTAVGADEAGLVGDGWRLTLNPGWIVRPGEREGDLLVVREAGPD